MVYKKAPNYPKFAMKVIRKTPATGAFSSESEEVKIMQRLDHPNIIRVESFYATDDAFFIIMEAALGGELLDYVGAILKNETRKQ
jgi:serine/threonine protein kinase